MDSYEKESHLLISFSSRLRELITTTIIITIIITINIISIIINVILLAKLFLIKIAVPIHIEHSEDLFCSFCCLLPDKQDDDDDDDVDDGNDDDDF